MFELDPAREFLQLDPASIVALYQSVNNTSVLLPGEPSQMAKAVICAAKGEGGYQLSIALHLIDSGRHLVYVQHDTPWLDKEGARVAAEEAIVFVESMGFFTENAHWRDLDRIARVELLALLKVFQPPPERIVEEVKKVVDPRVKLARLLVQF